MQTPTTDFAIYQHIDSVSYGIQYPKAFNVLTQNLSIDDNGDLCILSFAAVTFGTASPVLDDITVLKVNNIRNYVISEPNFIRFINSLSAIAANQTLTGQGLALTAILMARCGLRPSEALKLRLKDVEPSAQHCIFIRPNRFGTNKSYSARRKIPLLLMLLPDEFILFKTYLKRRLLDANNQPELLLFPSGETSNHPYSLSNFHNQFSNRLSSICGEKVSTYHLRHKALSTLQLVLMSESLACKTPYGNKQTDKIRRFFAVDCGRDVLFELAAFAGHLSPETTLRNYLHFTDVILYENLTSNKEALSRRYWKNLSTLSKHIFTRRCANITPSHEEVKVLLLESLNVIEPASLLPTRPELKEQTFHPPKRQVRFSECLTALKLLDTGATVSEVADKLEIDDGIIEKWYT